jgi:hypothetical protein
MNSEIILTKNHWTPLESHGFKNVCFGQNELEYKTDVALFVDDTHLKVKFECFNSQFVEQNTYSEHNTPLYNQEVFEVFISEGKENPNTYLEFEINPNNAIWTGMINNPDLEGNKISAKMISEPESGIIHSATKDKNSWKGEFAIPLSLIGEGSDVYRLNFYRIVAIKSQEPNWVCNTNNCKFLGWQPTLSGKNPAFHKPKKFGVLKIR